MSNIFNNYEDQLNKTSNAGQIYTGVTNLKVIAINPTKEQLTKILGDESRAEKFDTTYEVRKNPYSEQMVRPVNIWYTDFEENMSPTLFSIELADVEVKSGSSDNVQVINSHLQSSYALSPKDLLANPNMSWFSDTGIRVARIGEVDYYKLISTLLKYDLRGNKTFDAFVTETKIDFDSVYNGNFEGLHALVDYANENNFVFAALLLAKEKETEEGVRYRQDILKGADYFYRSSVDKDLSSVIDNLKDKAIKKEADGYQLTSKLYTYEFMPFNKEKCVNSEPEEVANSAAKKGSWV